MKSWVRYQASEKEGEKEPRGRFQHSQGKAFRFGLKPLCPSSSENPTSETPDPIQRGPRTQT